MAYWSLKFAEIRNFLTSAARWIYGAPEPPVIDFLPRTYGKNGTKPRKRWIRLILRSSHSTWHLKVAFHGTIEDEEHPIYGKGLKRRNDLQDLCQCIDFCRIRLLDDTVTEVILSLVPDTHSIRLPCRKQPDSESEYASVINDIWVRTREDPLRIRYPLLSSDSGVPIMELADLREKEELDGHAVHRVLLHGDDTVYIYKEVERAHYVPPDTEVLEQELRNLVLFRGDQVGIIQLVAAVVSQNPYQTTQTGKENASSVLRGLLLEYHPNGTLEDALKSSKPENNRRWRQWALQISLALAEMHRRGLAHMDLKPSNMVISANFDAVLIDISGIGGVTRQWLSPEMLSEKDPLSRSIQARQQNDIWALGQIMLTMADACGAQEDMHLLRSIAQAATRPRPRVAAGDIIAALSEQPSPSI